MMVGQHSICSLSSLALGMWIFGAAACVLDPAGIADGVGGHPDAAGTTVTSASGGNVPDGGAGGACSDWALEFQGDQYVTIPNGSTLNQADNFMLAAWVYPFDVSGEQHIASHHYPASGQGYVLMIKDNCPAFRLYVPTPCDCRNSEKFLQANKWYHIAASFLGGSAYLFQNGEMIQKCSCGASGTKVAPHDGPFRIGASSDAGGFFFKGLVDDVILHKALTGGFAPGALSQCTKDTLFSFTFAEGKEQSTVAACGGLLGVLGPTANVEKHDPIWRWLSCHTDKQLP